jgi:hypothetical protein
VLITFGFQKSSRKLLFGEQVPKSAETVLTSWKDYLSSEIVPAVSETPPLSSAEVFPKLRVSVSDIGGSSTEVGGTVSDVGRASADVITGRFGSK